MNLSFKAKVLSIGAVLTLVGAGCSGSPVAPTASESDAPVSTSTISVSSPAAGSTVSDDYKITGQAPAGESVYAVAMVGEEVVSLTFTDADAQGNFSMDNPLMGSVPAGDFVLELYNLDADFNWVNTLDVPLKFKP